MSKILLQMHLAESYSQYIPRQDKRTALKDRDSLLRYNQMILQENKVTEEEFRSSMQYYSKNTPLLDSIYQIVLAEIAILEANENK